jgi:hypothetical protein
MEDRSEKPVAGAASTTAFLPLQVVMPLTSVESIWG